MIVFYFLVGIMPLSEHRIWGRMLGNLTIFKYVGIAAVIYALGHVLSKGSIPAYFRTRQARLFVVFCLIAVESHFTKSFGGDFGVSPLFSYISFLLLFFVTVTVVDSVHRLRIVMLPRVYPERQALPDASPRPCRKDGPPLPCRAWSSEL